MGFLQEVSIGFNRLSNFDIVSDLDKSVHRLHSSMKTVAVVKLLSLEASNRTHMTSFFSPSQWGNAINTAHVASTLFHQIQAQAYLLNILKPNRFLKC